MTSQRRRVVSPPRQASPGPSPPLSAVRSSPLATGSLPSYPVTASPFSSSPALSSTQRGSSASPDLFDDFTYAEDMDDDFRRIDRETETQSSEDGRSSPSLSDGAPDSPSPAFSMDRRAWVVFHGTMPGIHNDNVSAIIQSQGFSGGFYKTFPDRELAQAAWDAFTRDGIYPGYGKGPWVVFLGRWPGVFIRVTELEACVKGYENAIFRSCSSVTDGNIRFQLFTERVVRMFAGSDPFPGGDVLIPQQPGRGDPCGTTPAFQRAAPLPVSSRSVTPIPVAPKRITSVPAAPKHLVQQTAESSKVAAKRKLKASRPGDGWYVAHNAVAPGTYYGVDALSNAKPVPGGFLCASDKEAADQLFLDLTLNGAIIWADTADTTL